MNDININAIHIGRRLPRASHLGLVAASQAAYGEDALRERAACKDQEGTRATAEEPVRLGWADVRRAGREEAGPGQAQEDQDGCRPEGPRGRRQRRPRVQDRLPAGGDKAWAGSAARIPRQTRPVQVGLTRLHESTLSSQLKSDFLTHFESLRVKS